MVERLNLAVQRIRKFGNGPAFTRHLSNLQRSERANAKTAGNLLDGLRKAYSKLVAIRIDLGYFAKYGPKNGVHAQAITAEQAQKHRDRFLAYLRKGPFNKHLAGYIWKMEYALEKGIHYHFAIFLDGQQVRSYIVGRSV
ncbi:inovirus-type Gp2 protein [Pantoea ananatis]|uniref:YagK/YfjJ domain-containing protein n=1 Tax=Pantoea ananas TaxID=553 RepID=UPI0039B99595